MNEALNQETKAKRFVTHPGSLYDYNAGMYCGVLMKEGTMRKLANLHAEHAEKVRRLLHDEADKGNVFPSSWTLHYPGGKQTTVKFINPSEDVKQRIEAALRIQTPQHEPLVFIASSMDEAERMADERVARLEAAESEFSSKDLAPAESE